MIVSLDLDAKEATIRFDGNRDAVYAFHELEQIEHAYAVTVHKSQGSEFPVVIMPLFGGGGRFLSRNLLIYGAHEGEGKGNNDRDEEHGGIYGGQQPHTRALYDARPRDKGARGSAGVLWALKKLLKGIADWLFPYIPKCVCCGVEKGVDDYLCKRCAAELEALKAGEVQTSGF